MNTNLKISSHNRQFIIQVCIGLICFVGYSYLAIESNHDTGIDLFDFLGGYWAIAAVVLLYWFYLYTNDLRINYGVVVIWAVIFRIVGIAGSPMLEDDFYRYLLDGCVFISTGSPYGITPESLFQVNSLSRECRDALTWVNNPDLPTIYGPLLQYVFALAHIISPANINLLQAILVLFDIGVVLILCRFTSARNVLLYAWNPLILKEIAFTAHPDIIGVFFLMAAFAARFHRKTAIAALFIALSCASKIFALLLLPYFLYRQKFRYWFITGITICLLYLPFLIQGYTEMFVTGVFAGQWVFNASIFQLFRNVLPDLAARLICLGMFASWWTWYFFNYHSTKPANEIPRGDWIFGMFFLFSPVVNPWYMVWLLPFAVLRPTCWAWIMSVAVSLTYITGINLIESDLNAYEIAEWAFAFEVAIIGFALVYDYRKSG